MKNILEERTKYWIGAIAFGIMSLVLSYMFGFKEKTEICVIAPEEMQEIIEGTVQRTALKRDYTVKFVTRDGDFVITEGADAQGKRIAYSPIIAVFNAEQELFDNYVSEEVFVKSEVDSTQYDFDFKKIIEQVLSDTGSSLKIYCPSKNSTLWKEFYNFLIYTVNDGYLPKDNTDMYESQEKVENFLKSKNVVYIDESAMDCINSIPKDSIYFTTYVNLRHSQKVTSGYDCRIMYPKSVVCHSYKADYNNLGKVLYDGLDLDATSIFDSTTHVGYSDLCNRGYNTKYVTYAIRIGDKVQGARNEFNVVEISD